MTCLRSLGRRRPSGRRPGSRSGPRWTAPAQLTDARLGAYYRAMAARDLITAPGSGPTACPLLIDEDRREDDPEIVRIAPLPRDAVRP